MIIIFNNIQKRKINRIIVSISYNRRNLDLCFFFRNGLGEVFDDVRGCYGSSVCRGEEESGAVKKRVEWWRKEWWRKEWSGEE